MITELKNMVKQIDGILDTMPPAEGEQDSLYFALGDARHSLIEAILLVQERIDDTSFEAGIAAIQAAVKGSK